jgi:hypothetical protein
MATYSIGYSGNHLVVVPNCEAGVFPVSPKFENSPEGEAAAKQWAEEQGYSGQVDHYGRVVAR